MSNARVHKFVEDINSINGSNAQQVLSEIYTNDVVFIDPVKEVNGLTDLTTYFEALYKSLSACHFTISNYTQNEENNSIEWVMRFQHKSIANNKPIELDGASFIEYKNGKVCLHRDYYDLGAMLYEHIPVLGSVIRKVRSAI